MLALLDILTTLVLSLLLGPGLLEFFGSAVGGLTGQ